MSTKRASRLKSAHSRKESGYWQYMMQNDSQFIEYSGNDLLRSILDCHMLKENVKLALSGGTNSKEDLFTAARMAL